jgi:hypothetical protein
VLKLAEEEQEPPLHDEALSSPSSFMPFVSNRSAPVKRPSLLSSRGGIGAATTTTAAAGRLLRTKGEEAEAEGVCANQDPSKTSNNDRASV